MLQRIEHRPAASRSLRARQRGVVAIEFALMFLFGLLPLLLLTFNGVLIFAAKQSLTLAAASTIGT
jgi:Flp pilus assembly protein TadG